MPLGQDNENTYELLPGGWTYYSCQIDDATRKVFEQALEDIIGVEYWPVAVATQVVAGTNFSFFCNSRMVVPNAVWKPALVSIHRDLNGKVELCNIRIMEPFEATQTAE